MTSNFIAVRSLGLLRESLYFSFWTGAFPAQDCYVRFAVLADIEVERFEDMVRDLDLDVADLVGAIARVSAHLKEYVERFGTGTHGGAGRGPRES